MMQPNASLDWLFVRSFCEEDERFDRDMPVIMRDFFLHEAERIPEYSHYIYANDGFGEVGAIEGIRYKFFNLLLAGARHGSGFSAEMICRIYKIYYKSEYNQLKRFKTLSYEELRGFDSDEEMFATTAARILIVASFMGIDINEDCEAAVGEAEDVVNDDAFEFKFTPEEYSFGESAFEEAKQTAEEVISRLESKQTKKYDPYFDNDARKFIWDVFCYHGVPTSFDISCDVGFESEKRQFAVTIAILKKMWPDRTFSDSEIQMFAALYHELTVLVNNQCVLDDIVDYLLGRTDRFRIDVENCMYKPEKQVVTRAVPYMPAKRNENSGNTKPALEEKNSAVIQNLYDEIEHLRASIKEKDQSIDQLSRMYRETSQKLKQEMVDAESWEDDRTELARLREHLYHLTEDDLEGQNISTDKMEQEIRDKRIIIIGGHDNWVHFLREKFPSWTYIKPGVANTIPENAVMQAERLFFFTDTISHAAYGKFVHAARIHGIPFGYLHGTNIPETIRQIYNAMASIR